MYDRYLNDFQSNMENTVLFGCNSVNAFRMNVPDMEQQHQKSSNVYYHYYVSIRKMKNVNQDCQIQPQIILNVSQQQQISKNNLIFDLKIRQGDNKLTRAHTPKTGTNQRPQQEQTQITQNKHDEEQFASLMEERQGNIKRQTNNYLSENIIGKLAMTGLAALILFTFRLFGIPDQDVQCIDDKVHDVLNPLNRFFNENLVYTNAMIAVSSFCMDAISLSIFVYWLLYVRNVRFMLCVILFYLTRSIQMQLFHMRFPFGFYFNDPKVLSLSVPYGRTSDFFFSGHCGFLSIAYFEWRALGWKKAQLITFLAGIFLAFMLLSLKVHYSIDISTGVIFAHYVHILATHFHESIEKWIYSAQIYLTRLFSCKKVQDALEAESIIYEIGDIPESSTKGSNASPTPEKVVENKSNA